MKQERLQIVLPKWLKDELKRASDDKGISMGEYIKDTLKAALTDGTLPKARENKPKSDAI